MASNPALQVSVSFGRFENDSLSWEKWSSFSPNKYLEEVEKCATPGSVAQKKAYFEAHYKNIAARKAELLAQEKQTEGDPFRSPCRNGEDLSCNTCGDDADFDVSNNTQGSIEGAKQETDYAGDHVDNFDDGVAVSKDYQSPSIEGENEEVENRSPISQKDNKPEEAIFVEGQGESPNIEGKEHVKEISQNVENETGNASGVKAIFVEGQGESPNIEGKEHVKEISQNVENETGNASGVKAKDVKLDYPKASKTKKFGQVTPVNKESNATKLKQKPVPPSSKASQISTPRNSRPTSTPTKTLASASKTIRGNTPSLSARKVTSTGENKKVPNKSLHMSLSLGPSKPDPAPNNTTMRKSFIMEKMGDKDIVKRAFKTFQNNFNQSKTFGEDKSLVKKQVPSRGTEPRAPTSTALRKDNGQATKVDSLDTRSGNAVRTTLGLKSDIRAEKGKESPRKIEEKSNAKEVEKTRLQSKSKDEKLKNNFKATPMPAFYRGQKVSKSNPEKGNVKIEKQR